MVDGAGEAAVKRFVAREPVVPERAVSSDVVSERPGRAADQDAVSSAALSWS